MSEQTFWPEITKFCDVKVKDAYLLSQEDFACIRRNGFGASDSAALLGMRPYGKSIDDLIEEKCTNGYTEKEKMIGDLVNVRKGRDLEPIILEKAAQQLGVEVFKPVDMFQLKDAPYLTINFDGLTSEAIPVEAKFISLGGDKYWDFNVPERTSPMPKYSTVEEQYKASGEYYGVPAYYYTQVQQQLLGVGTDFAYLAALRDKTWNVHIIKIFRDPIIQNGLIINGAAAWNKVLKQRGANPGENTNLI